MSDDPYPELTTNGEWRILMVAGRKEREWSQHELATQVARHSKLTATQALISQIESGKIVSSKLVRPICEVMSIPEPMHFSDEKMKQWWLVGHLMRNKSTELFLSQLDSAYNILRALGIAPPAANDDDADEGDRKPPRK